MLISFTAALKLKTIHSCFFYGTRWDRELRVVVMKRAQMTLKSELPVQ